MDSHPAYVSQYLRNGTFFQPEITATLEGATVRGAAAFRGVVFSNIATGMAVHGAFQVEM